MTITPFWPRRRCCMLPATGICAWPRGVSGGEHGGRQHAAPPPRHPLEGRSLQVLGSMRRHGAAELLVVLPDGSKRLIPAAWTDLEQPADGDDAAATLGSVSDLLHASVLVSGLCARAAG